MINTVKLILYSSSLAFCLIWLTLGLIGIHRKKRKKIVYIAHAISGNIEENLADIRRIIKIINTYPEYERIVPFCPYYTDVVSIDDNDPVMRARGIANDEIYFKRKSFDEVWLTGSVISTGMWAESKLAKRKGIKVVNKIDML